MSTVDARRRLERRRALRASLIALVSTVVVFGALALIIVNAPGWPAVQDSFFNGPIFVESAPSIVRAFLVNIRLFVIAEILVLALGLVIAVVRSLPGPVFFPLRIIAIVYADIFRAIPGIVVIFMIGFGIHGLGFVIPRRTRSGTASRRSRSCTRPTCRRSTGRGSSRSIRARTPPPGRSG